MRPVVAVGVPAWPEGAGSDATALVAPLAALLVVRFLIGLRLSPPTFALSVLAGLLFPYAADEWGVIPAYIGAFLLAAILSFVVPRLPSPSEFDTHT